MLRASEPTQSSNAREAMAMSHQVRFVCAVCPTTVTMHLLLQWIHPHSAERCSNMSGVAWDWETFLYVREDREVDSFHLTNLKHRNMKS